MAFVGSLARYQIQASASGPRVVNVNLRWTPPPSHAGEVDSVDYKIMGGRRPGSQPVKIVMSCPEGGFADNTYSGIQAMGNYDLTTPIELVKCKKPLKYSVRARGADIDDGGARGNLSRSFAIRLTGKVVTLPGGGYAASFGPHDSEWNCGPPTWPSREHQAAGLPPYAEWCDLDIGWRDN